IIRMDAVERELNPETLQKSYGLGWLIQDYHGTLLWSHTGGLEGFRSRVVLVPKEKLGVVILTNSGVGASAASMHLAATNNLLDPLLGFPKRDWDALYAGHVKELEAGEKAAEEAREAKRARGTKPSRELAAYAGAYDDPGYGTVTVSVADGALRLAWSSFADALEHHPYDTFTVKGDDPIQKEQGVFTLAGAGEVAPLRFLGRDFRRKQAKPA